MTIKNLYTLIVESLELSYNYLINPEKRVFYGYLISSFLLTLFVYFKAKNKTDFFSKSFGKHIWFSSSALTDYCFLLFNSLIKIVLIAPFLIWGLKLSYETTEWLNRTIGLTNLAINQFWTLLLYTFCITLANDFIVFLTHYLMHKIPLLWEFHKTHHSATVLNPITQYRIHPVELIINNMGAMLVFGLLTGLFDFWSNYTIHPISFLGANVFSFVFLFWGANLRHSHVKLTYFNWLEYIFISPFQHQIHHSNNNEHFNKNMGSKLALWDWLFGTLLRSEEVDELNVGLGEEDKDYNSFWKNIWMPFKKVFTR